MNRLTYQKRDGNYSIRFDLGNLQQVDIKATNKLGKLEDIEQDLGCPLEVVFNLLYKEIVIFGKYKGRVLDIRKDGDIFCIHYFNGTLGYDDIEPLSNYGKTFWLKDYEVNK